MPIPVPNIVGPMSTVRSVAVDGQELVNFYAERQGEGAKAPWILLPTPGLKYITTVGNLGGNRGMFTTARERLLIVIGNKLIELKADLSEVELGQLKTKTGRVAFAEVISSTGSYVQLVDGVKGYVLTTETNAFAEIVDPSYEPGTSIVSLNGFFIQNTNETWYGGTRFIYSGQFDQANTWDAGIDWFTAEVSPDPIYNLQVINGEMWVFGTKTTEIWYYTGNTEQIFARVTSGLINIGVGGRNAVCSINNQVAWLGSNKEGNGSIWLGSGYIPKQISTNSIEYIIGQMADPSDCVAFSYMQEGETFLIFNFISGNRTLCYELSSGLWHERGSYNTRTGKNDHHRVVTCTLWQQRIYVGDYDTNQIFEWDLDTYKDHNQIIRRVRTASHLHADRKRVIYRSLEIDMERGTSKLPAAGPVDQVGTEAKVMLTWSDDGGYTWSNEVWETVGRTGNRYARVKFNRLGMSRDRVFRVTFSDDIKFIVISGVFDIDVSVR
jgi:hypothetical protein